MVRVTFIIVAIMTGSRSAAGGRPADGPDLPVANVIDQRIFARLGEAGITPSPLSTDVEFLRRVTLTTTGQLPSANDVRDFLKDKGPDRRARKIDELLAHPLHAALWATRFCEMTGNDVDSLEGPDELKPKRAKMWHDWLRRRFAENMPYDDLVRGILTATSRDRGEATDEWIDREAALTLAARAGFDADYAQRESLNLFWRRKAESQQYPIETMAERVASSFLGVRIGCAKCHAHPFDPWTQEDYRSFANVFGQVRFDMSPASRAALAARLDQRRARQAAGEAAGPPLPRVAEVYLAENSAALRDEVTGERLPAKALGGPVLSAAGQAEGGAVANDQPGDLRVHLMDWLNEPDNPHFARNIVNRTWALHFGRGLVEPLDGLSAAKAPEHGELLNELADDFVAHGYDLRRLERLILNSTTWQLSSAANDSNRTDLTHFSRAQVRIPPPHAVVDMWLAAVGVPGEFGDDVPPGIRAVEIAPSRLAGTPWDRLLNHFGRASRTQPCDCAPPPGPSIRQTLALMCDPALLEQLPNGRVGDLCDAELSDEAVVEDLFLNTLSRLPTDKENAAAVAHLAKSSNRRAACEDLLWSLLNTQEFVTIH